MNANKHYVVKVREWNRATGHYEDISEDVYDEYEVARAAVTKATGRKRRDRGYLGGVKHVCEFFTGQQSKQAYFVVLVEQYIEKETA